MFFNLFKKERKHINSKLCLLNFIWNNSHVVNYQTKLGREVRENYKGLNVYNLQHTFHYPVLLGLRTCKLCQASEEGKFLFVWCAHCMGKFYNIFNFFLSFFNFSMFWIKNHIYLQNKIVDKIIRICVLETSCVS